MDDQFDSGGFGAESPVAVKKSHNWGGGVRKHVAPSMYQLPLDGPVEVESITDEHYEPVEQPVEQAVAPADQSHTAQHWAGASMPRWWVWIYAPHTGVEPVLKQITDHTARNMLSDRVYTFAEHSTWSEQGGQLLVNLSDVNSQNNGHLVSACERAVVGYLVEPDLLRWRHTALLECASGANCGRLPSVVTLPNWDLVELVHVHSWMWQSVLNQWQCVFPGKTISVSEDYGAQLPELLSVVWSPQALDQMEPAEKPTKIRILEDIVQTASQPKCGMYASDLTYFLNKVPLYHAK